MEAMLSLVPECGAGIAKHVHLGAYSALMGASRTLQAALADHDLPPLKHALYHLMCRRAVTLQVLGPLPPQELWHSELDHKMSVRNLLLELWHDGYPCTQGSKGHTPK